VCWFCGWILKVSEFGPISKRRSSFIYISHFESIDANIAQYPPQTLHDESPNAGDFFIFGNIEQQWTQEQSTMYDAPMTTWL
jgi:hypothetical protein